MHLQPGLVFYLLQNVIGGVEIKASSPYVVDQIQQLVELVQIPVERQVDSVGLRSIRCEQVFLILKRHYSRAWVD